MVRQVGCVITKKNQLKILSQLEDRQLSNLLQERTDQLWPVSFWQVVSDLYLLLLVEYQALNLLLIIESS